MPKMNDQWLKGERFKCLQPSKLSNLQAITITDMPDHYRSFWHTERSRKMEIFQYERILITTI